MKIRKLLLTVATLVVFSSAAKSAVIPVSAGSLGGPTVGLATSLAAQYRFNADGSIDTLVDSTVLSTDGIEDTLVGVLNNSGHTINSLSLTGTGISGEGIFGFEFDGQSTIPNPGTGPGDSYFGQYFDANNILLGTVFFTVLADDNGTVHFPGLPNGGWGWWVLEDQIDFSAPPVVVDPPPVVTPIPAAVWLFGSGLFGLLGINKKRKAIAA
jgi:hypothetical protein